MNGLEIANVATEVVIAILAAAANVIVLYTLWANKSLQVSCDVQLKTEKQRSYRYSHVRRCIATRCEWYEIIGDFIFKTK